MGTWILVHPLIVAQTVLTLHFQEGYPPVVHSTCAARWLMVPPWGCFSYGSSKLMAHSVQSPGWHNPPLSAAFFLSSCICPLCFYFSSSSRSSSKPSPCAILFVAASAVFATLAVPLPETHSIICIISSAQYFCESV